MATMKIEKLKKRRSKLLLNYFFNVKGKAAIILLFLFIIAGAFAFLTSSSSPVESMINSKTHLYLGSGVIFLFLLFLLALLNVFTNRITCDEEVEALLNIDKKAAFDEMFSNFALKNDQKEFICNPIEITYPEVYPGRNTIVYRYSKESKKVYYSQVGFNWLMFGQKTFYYYHMAVNHIYGYVGYGVAEEVNYKDIVSVKTVTTRRSKFEKVTLFLSLKSGEKIEIVLRNRPTKSEGSTENLNEQEKLVLGIIRKTIREQK